MATEKTIEAQVEEAREAYYNFHKCRDPDPVKIKEDVGVLLRYINQLDKRNQDLSTELQILKAVHLQLRNSIAIASWNVKDNVKQWAQSVMKRFNIEAGKDPNGQVPR